MTECLLCGVEYEVCKYCPKVVKYTPWRQECESMRHWQILMVARGVRDGQLKPSEARKQLDNLKVTVEEVKTFRPLIQAWLLQCFDVKSKPIMPDPIEEPVKAGVMKDFAPTEEPIEKSVKENTNKNAKARKFRKK